MQSSLKTLSSFCSRTVHFSQTRGLKGGCKARSGVISRRTAANEPSHCGGIVFPPLHCFPALLIVPRPPPPFEPPGKLHRPKNNVARNYFSIDETPIPSAWNVAGDCTKLCALFVWKRGRYRKTVRIWGGMEFYRLAEYLNRWFSFRTEVWISK